jgi:hypothetical protein
METLTMLPDRTLLLPVCGRETAFIDVALVGLTAGSGVVVGVVVDAPATVPLGVEVFNDAVALVLEVQSALTFALVLLEVLELPELVLPLLVLLFVEELPELLSWELLFATLTSF